LSLLVALASVACLGFGSAFVFAGSKAGTGQIGMRDVRVHNAARRTGATLIGKRGVAKTAPIPGGSIENVCKGSESNGTFTLTENCGDVTSSITVPATITTVNGDGYTISAADSESSQFSGGILTNAPGNHTMKIENLTVSGPAGGFAISTNCNKLYGIYFDNAGGSLNQATVENIWQQPNASGAPSCNTGTAIRADHPSAPRTLTITHTTVMEYQKNGIDGRCTDSGDPACSAGMTMDVSDSTIGPPNNQEGLIAANGLLYFGGATGKAENNTILGSGDQGCLPLPAVCKPGTGGATDATAVLLYGSKNVTITHNAIGGGKTDIGVSATFGSTGSIISFNDITRTSADDPDPTGHGIDVTTPDGSSATPICNTFSNWNHNIVGAEQISCTSLPDGTECEAYSAPAPAVDSGKNYSNSDPSHIIGATPFTWTVDSGTLPPGLSLSSAGAITGVPTARGTFDFTMKVVDSTGLTATRAQTITIHPDCGTTSPSTSTVTVTTAITLTEPATTVTVPPETITHSEAVTLPADTVTTPGQTTVVTVPARQSTTTVTTPGQTTVVTVPVPQSTTTVTTPAQTTKLPPETKTVVVTVTTPSHGVLLPAHVIREKVKVRQLVKTVFKTVARACKAVPHFGPGKG
jgi:hypothetical protein